MNRNLFLNMQCNFQRKRVSHFENLDKLGACGSVDRTWASGAEADKSQEQEEEQENHHK